ncbi:MAG TPA: ATP-dependent Clp protease adaptor ClpS [Bradyrhizobium sp.]|nr:ATP-dependent Clp protease adaptor ClpS [Bradyrhizobium sp.]
MDQVCAGEPIQLVLHDDDNTPSDFVLELLRNVFGHPEKDAIALTVLSEIQGKVVFGPYPPTVAHALLAAAQERIRQSGHDVLITTATSARTSGSCDLCGAPAPATEAELATKTVFLCEDCVRSVMGAAEQSPHGIKYVNDALDRHFAGVPRHELTTTTRMFPGHMRADVQVAVEKLFASPTRFFGLHEEYRHETLTIARCMQGGRYPPVVAPPQFQEVDVGDGAPVQCLENGLWLSRVDEVRYGLLLSLDRDHDRGTSVRVEILVPAGARGQAFVQRCFGELERAVHAARSYRGKILSFDGGANYRGRARGIMVHRLPPVARDEVILPEATLKLLDRNVLDFIAKRDALRSFGLSTRKGILLYGPPGTGKTHTIRYLATNLPGHTTLIITAEQMGLLEAYINLARLLQPAMVVIEDVDLIARARDQMADSCEESLLNKLLNEMDGLKEDADILFVLTTNRPEALEAALAGRPGRIDQAIEVPLPDATGRGKLIRLYGRGLPLDEPIVTEAGHRTEGVSAAFIKELMRRIAQSSLARDGGNSVTSDDIDEALDDMLFTGGRLNVKLLGGAQEMAVSPG